MTPSQARTLAGLGCLWCVAIATILLFVDDGAAGRTVLDSEGSVWKGNWRYDEDAVPCAEDPMCGYGGVSLDPKAYEDPSPLALIREDYKEGQLNPMPGPRNYGPDSPYAWLPEEAGDGYPARKVWPDYPAEKETGESEQTNGASTSDRSVEMLRMVPRLNAVRGFGGRPQPQYVRVY